jgi:MinD-like ATPase involved in chromosome partitioning or flagellar assembly
MKSTVDQTPSQASATAMRTRYLVVCSGIDKVGKSTVCINLAIALARTGRRVCIIDTDSSVSNAHRSLGLSPGYSLASVARQECNIRDAIGNGPEGIQLLLDGGYRKEAKSLQVLQQRDLLNQIRNWQQDLDLVLVDTTTETDDLEQWMTIADSLLVLLAPQSQVLSETFSLLSHLSPPCIKKPMHLVINRSDGARQAKSTFHKFGAAAKKYLDTELLYCGHIASDDNIRNSVALQYPVALYSREDPTCAAFFELAGMLEHQWAESTSCGAGLAEGYQWMTSEPASQLFTPANTSNRIDKTQFLQMPALADELIDRGALGPEELRQVIEALLATAHHEFPATFRDNRDNEKGQHADNNNGQQSLLEKLRQSRDANHSLDQRLYDFAKKR